MDIQKHVNKRASLRLSSMNSLIELIVNSLDAGEDIEELVSHCDDMIGSYEGRSPAEAAVFDGLAIAIKNILKFSQHS